MASMPLGTSESAAVEALAAAAHRLDPADTAASDYLRLAAEDPVAWYPWGAPTLARARVLDRPLLLSIGFAAAHWCHVMREESFRDPAIAQIINGHFVPVALDRDQRPDLDAWFLRATQSLTGSGGWPLTVFCTPSGQPFFAGTYYPAERTGDMPAFEEVLVTLVAAWRDRRTEVLDSADQIHRLLTAPPPPTSAPATRPLVAQVAEAYDPVHGGFGRGAKFPHPALLDALLVRGDAASLDLAVTTLERMARSGLRDQVGGGFHRYATDAAWASPSFEKTLADNALLLGVYANAWRRVPDHQAAVRDLFADVVETTVEWVRRELTLPTGGAAASLDADSCDVRGLAGEGLYYLWNPDLLVDALGPVDGSWAQALFHVTAGGTFDHGYSVCQLRGPLDWERLTDVRARLLAVRQGRFAPPRDDTLIASWNGWLVDAVVRAAGIFGRPDWLDFATATAEALWTQHWSAGRLSRTRWTPAARTESDGQAGHPAGAGRASPRSQGHAALSLAADGSLVGQSGLAEDYGAVALAYLRLAGALGDRRWADRADQLLTTAWAQLAAPDGGVWDGPDETAFWPIRPRSHSDAATASGSAALVQAFRLAALTLTESKWAERADTVAATAWPALVETPLDAGAALADRIVAEEAHRGLAPALVLVVTPERDPVACLAQAAWRMAPAGSAVLVEPSAEPGGLGPGVPPGRDQVATAGPMAWVWRLGQWSAGTSEIGALREVLWRRVGWSPRST
jgi:uncharacterized protein YyaL (SSP411 family)